MAVLVDLVLGVISGSVIVLGVGCRGTPLPTSPGCTEAKLVALHLNRCHKGKMPGRDRGPVTRLRALGGMAPTGRAGDEATIKEELGIAAPRQQRSSRLGSMAAAAGEKDPHRRGQRGLARPPAGPGKQHRSRAATTLLLRWRSAPVGTGHRSWVRP